MSISIIVPILNEVSQLPDLLAHLLECKRAGCEIILVDGGSTDQSPEQAEALGFSVLRSETGRAIQMNTGAQAAQGEILLFLHADTRLPDNADLIIQTALMGKNSVWGRFDVRITGSSIMFNVIAWFMNKRSRLTGIVTGDQGIFMHRRVFEELGGFPVQPLMEDIEFSKSMKSLAKPIALKDKVTTSGRRWEQRGIWKTIFLMWSLRYAYWRGESSDMLVSRYR